METASFLTTFLLLSSMYRYLRAPMGLSSSSNEFCCRSDAVFAGLLGVHKLVDDILVEGNDLEDLEAKIRAVLLHCHEHGFVLSKKKFEIGPEVNFTGYTVSAAGVCPCLRRLEAIAEFPMLKDLTSLRSFLGLCNQLAIFIPDLATQASPLHSLLKKNVPFCWLPDHTLAFETMKANLVKTVSVHHFNRKLHTKLIMDVSKLNGIGFLLIQTSAADSLVPLKLLQCGSHTLTAAERNYATIEVECLGIQALKKCDFFLHGLHSFLVVTDHWPLVGVFSKPLSTMENPRLVQIIEKTSPYSFDVMWTSGKDNVIADALSCNPIGLDADVPVWACVVRGSGVVNQMLKSAADCTSYQAILSAFQHGQHPSALPATHPLRHLLSVWNRLLLVDSGILCVDAKRIFVPIAYQKSILRKLHVEHSGITKMYNMAHTLYFWPGLKNDVMNLVSACDKCQVHQASLPVDNFVTTTTSTPMELISANLFQFGNGHYLIVIDRFSNFFFTYKLSSLTSKAVIDKLRACFMIFGFPHALRTDGSLQFQTDFWAFCNTSGILHQLSSPYNSQSNGSAKSGVKAVKAIMAKCQPSAWEEAFFTLFNSCNASGDSPTSLFFKRNIRSSFPILDVMQPLTTNSVGDRSSDKLRPLKVGQRVRIQNRIPPLFISPLYIFPTLCSYHLSISPFRSSHYYTCTFFCYITIIYFMVIQYTSFILRRLFIVSFRIHHSGRFNFQSFPDTGSGASVMSADLASLYGLAILLRHSDAIFCAVNGQRIKVNGVVFGTVCVPSSRNELLVAFIVTPISATKSSSGRRH